MEAFAAAADIAAPTATASTCLAGKKTETELQELFVDIKCHRPTTFEFFTHARKKNR